MGAGERTRRTAVAQIELGVGIGGVQAHGGPRGDGGVGVSMLAQERERQVDERADVVRIEGERGPIVLLGEGGVVAEPQIAELTLVAGDLGVQSDGLRRCRPRLLEAAERMQRAGADEVRVVGLGIEGQRALGFGDGFLVAREVVENHRAETVQPLHPAGLRAQGQRPID